MAPIQAEAIRGCTFLNSVGTQTKSSLAAATINRSEPCQCFLISSAVARRKIAAYDWSARAQLGSALYFGRCLTDGFDAPFANRPLRTGRGKGHGAQRAEHAWSSASEEGFVVVFRQACGLQCFPHRSGNHHVNMYHTNIFGPRKGSRKKR